jgi:NitT/TauT family transport system substrate-binding protein
MRTSKSLPAWIVVLVLVLAACSTGEQASESAAQSAPDEASEAPDAESVGAEPSGEAPADSVDLSVRLSWVAVGYDAPLLLAYREGWFEEAGLNLTIGEGSGSATTAKLIGNGSDDIGFVDSGTAALAIAEGVPIKVIGGMIQQTPLATIYRNDAGINEPADLEGKNWGVAPGSAATQIQPVFLELAGIDPDGVNMIGMEGSAYVQSLLSGRIDAFDSYALEQLPIINIEMGGDVSAFEWADYGVNVLGQGVVANSETIENDPEVLHRFLEVFARGWEAAIEDPDRAAEALRAEFPNAGGGNTEVVAEQLRRTIEKLHTANSEGEPLFWMAEEDWSDTQDILLEYGDLDEARPLDTYYTNDFVPQP